MTTSRLWETGSPEERWNGYLIEPGSFVLRNRLGISNTVELRNAENDLLEIRLAELRADPEIISKTYDLSHLQAIHRYLFQDVYEWAGELRTVGLARDGGESFAPPGNISQPMNHVSQRIAASNLLRNIPPLELPHEVAYLYDYMNFSHPFREGNGRAQREFFQQLLGESDLHFDWSGINSKFLHTACHTARNEGDLAPLEKLIRQALSL